MSMLLSSPRISPVSESISVIRSTLSPHRVDVHRVAANSELPADEVHVVPLVEDVGEEAQHLVSLAAFAATDGEHLFSVLIGGTEAVDTGDRCHDHDVAAFEQRLGCRVTQAVDLVVAGRVLLNVRV
jgi:hypothetical protein